MSKDYGSHPKREEDGVDSRLKQRLIGAFVIVVLAVIFVPYLIEQPTSSGPPVTDTAIPPPPVQPEPGERDLTFSLESETPAAEQPVAEEPIVTASNAESHSPEAADDTTSPPPVASGPDSDIPLPTEAESTLPMIEEPAPVAEPASSLAPRPTIEPVDVTKKPEPVRPKPATTPRPPPKPATAKPPEPPVEVPPKPTVAKQPQPKPVKKATAPPPPPPPKKTAPPAQVALPKVELIGRSSTQQRRSAANTQVAKAAPAPRARPSGGGRWIVQVGSFSLQQNAQNLRNRLRQGNFSAYVEPVRVSGQTMYRVRVGPQNSRAASEQMLTRLRQAGVSTGQVVSLR